MKTTLKLLFIGMIAVSLSGCALWNRAAEWVESQDAAKLLAGATAVELAYRIALNNPDDIPEMQLYCDSILNSKGGDTFYEASLEYGYNYLNDRIGSLSPGAQYIAQEGLATIIKDLGADIVDGQVQITDLDVERLKWVVAQFALGLEAARAE